MADLAGAVAVDEALVGGLLAEHDSGLHLLAAPNDPMAADGLDARTLAQAIDCLKRTHELVVVDTGPGMGTHALAAHAESDLSYVITSLELPAVKDAKMMLNALSQRASGVDDHVQIVLNRANSKVGFPPDEVARALGRSAAVELPSDVSVPRSINNGVVVALESPKSRIGKALTKLSADMRGDLFGRENASGRKSLLRVAKARAATS
jgi:pilus assembly protein CpaE